MIKTIDYQDRYLKWKETTVNGITSVSPENSQLFLKFLNDLERGYNIANGSKKGARSYARLTNLKDRLIYFDKNFNKYFGLNNITKVSEEQLITFFADMRSGKIRKKDGKEYKAVADYVKTIKTFWHWYMKVSKKETQKDIADITLDLDTRRDKPKWVYLTEDDVKRLCDNAKNYYKILMWFLFDSGVRPKELINIRVCDFKNDFKEVNIREETSKTFGRLIKLMRCSELIKEFVKINQLNDTDYLFTINNIIANQYLRRLARKTLGDKETLAGKKYTSLKLYDFRHSSACYWLPRYKNESGLKFRFGWKKSEMIHYYTELLGMRDTISQDDMLIDITKTEIEQELQKIKQERDLFKERLEILEKQVQQMQVIIIDEIEKKVDVLKNGAVI